jgi:microcompartment protein CcmK/EutM
MILGRVVGKAISTTKHRSYTGAKLLVVEPIRAASDDPVLCFDELGSRAGDLVVMSNDGIYAREILGDNQSPGRWWVMAIIDNAEEIDRKTA